MPFSSFWAGVSLLGVSSYHHASSEKYFVQQIITFAYSQCTNNVCLSYTHIYIHQLKKTLQEDLPFQCLAPSTNLNHILGNQDQYIEYYPHIHHPHSHRCHMSHQNHIHCSWYMNSTSPIHLQDNLRYSPLCSCTPKIQIIYQ